MSWHKYKLKKISWAKLIPQKESHEKIMKLSEEIEKLLKNLSNQKRIVLLGSVPRKTYLRKSKVDLDFFVYFETFDFELFLKELELFFKDCVLIPKNRGFPYCTIEYRKDLRINIDVVPCMTLKERTELHHEYLTEHLSDHLRSQIIYSKYLMKRIGLYNADSNVRGFSGYCIEVLILKFGSLTKVPDDLTLLVDPVDPFRNLLASVSPENLQRFHILKHKGFKHKASLLNDGIYLCENIGSRYLKTIKNDLNVLNAVYVHPRLFFELKDHYIHPKEISYNNPFWVEKTHQRVYTSVKDGLKVLKKQNFFHRYQNLKCRLLNSDSLKDLKLIKCYNFFK